MSGRWRKHFHESGLAERMSPLPQGFPRVRPHAALQAGDFDTLLLKVDDDAAVDLAFQSPKEFSSFDGGQGPTVPDDTRSCLSPGFHKRTGCGAMRWRLIGSRPIALFALPPSGPCWNYPTMKPMVNALIMSMKNADTSGRIMNAIGAGPWAFVTAVMLAIAVGVAPRLMPLKPADITAAW